MLKKNFKLDFAIIGVQKAGTTALHSFLSQHPKIQFGKVKELHYFDDNDLFDERNNELNNAQLKNNFSKSLFNFKKLKGDATPITVFYPNSLARLKNHNPSIKILLILRNPIERAFSHWKMETQKEKESLSFSEAIEKEESRIKSDFGFRTYSYKTRGLYSEQIERLLNLFPKEQILIKTSEDLKHKHNETIRDVLSYLNLEIMDIPKEIVHEGIQDRIDTKSKQFLIDFFTNDIIKTEALINLNLSDWLK